MSAPQRKRVIPSPAAAPDQAAAPKSGTPAEETLVGVVERLTCHSEESGYTIARLQVPCGCDLLVPLEAVRSQGDRHTSLLLP